MGRKPQISKEQILQTGLEMIIRHGWENVNIKTLAETLGCSTQPIAWYFGNMESFRNELYSFANSKARQQIYVETDKPFEDFFNIQKNIVLMAYEAPNLLKFLQNNNFFLDTDSGMGFVFDNKKNTPLAFSLSATLCIDVLSTKEFLKHSVLFTQGLVFAVLSNNNTIDVASAIKMLKDMWIRFLVSCGLNKSKVSGFFADFI